MARLQRSCIAILIYRMYNACKSYSGKSPFILDFVPGLRDVHEKTGRWVGARINEDDNGARGGLVFLSSTAILAPMLELCLWQPGVRKIGTR
jgi:hypothetical protein